MTAGEHAHLWNYIFRWAVSFDTDCHYIREQVALGLIETRHIPSDLQIAYILIKLLAKRQFVDLPWKI